MQQRRTPATQDIHASRADRAVIPIEVGVNEEIVKTLHSLRELHTSTRTQNGARLRSPVVLGHVRGRVTENITNDAHRWLGGIDEGVAHHKLFENIVLDSAL